MSIPLWLGTLQDLHMNIHTYFGSPYRWVTPSDETDRYWRMSEQERTLDFGEGAEEFSYWEPMYSFAFSEFFPKKDYTAFYGADDYGQMVFQIFDNAKKVEVDGEDL